MQKKVLIFSLAYYPRMVGGAEIAIKEITDRMPDVEFHLVCLGFDNSLPREEKIRNVFVHRIGWGATKPTSHALTMLRFRLLKLWFQFGAAFKGLSLNRKHKFDLLWAMMAHSCGVPAALFKLFQPSIPYVLTLQEGDPIPHIEKTMLPLWPLFVRAFTKADRVQVISTYLGKWARARGFTGPLEVIPNGVDVPLFSQAVLKERIQEIQQEVGKQEGDVFLVTTSRLVHKNGIDNILQAIQMLPFNIKFLSIGTGSDDIKLKSLAEELGVSSRVLFEAYKPQAELPAYLKACDIFIRPSRSEGMGNSFIEAFAAGLPVIATQEGGIADFLFDRKRNPQKAPTGFAVDVNAPEQIKDAVLAILSNPNETRTVIENAKQVALTGYDWSLIADSMRKKVFIL
jgi:glycosyltransferase involved in cell wall biosynthesis